MIKECFEYFKIGFKLTLSIIINILTSIEWDQRMNVKPIVSNYNDSTNNWTSFQSYKYINVDHLYNPILTCKFKGPHNNIKATNANITLKNSNN